ncbi:MAG TPA: hypothetical protein VGV64_06510 [Thermoplasmata archaeon]|nr:hypothetical protein [Thermoplasmata archaeon]
MMVRTPVLIFSIALLGVALLLQFLFPYLATIITYGLLAWLVASFFVFRSPVMSRPIGGRRPAAPLGSGPGPEPDEAAGSPPLASSPPVDLAFCAFCGADLPDGATSCPICRHAVQKF